MTNREHHFDLLGGRTLHYAETGDPTSKDVVLFFHGIFAIGTAPETLPVSLGERRVHYVAPTLPGWGTSSPPSNLKSYRQGLYDDMMALLTHLHPNQQESLRLYVAGVSFGTVAAQILYGAPYDVFPLGKRIVGLLLISPLPPFRVHDKYHKCLSWCHYFTLGAWARNVPFKLIPKIEKFVLRDKLDSKEHAAKWVRELAFHTIAEAEQEAYERWRNTNGKQDGDLEKEVGEMMYRSVKKTWAGFMDMPKVLYSNWGYRPKKMDKDHSVPVYVVAMKEDKEGMKFGEWLVKNMKNTKSLHTENGSMMMAVYMIDSLWAAFMSCADSDTHSHSEMQV